MFQFTWVPFAIIGIAFTMALVQVIIEMFFDVEDEFPPFYKKDDE